MIARYAHSLRQTCADEIHASEIARGERGLGGGEAHAAFRRRRSAAVERARVDEALGKSKVLATIYSMRQELASLWQRSNASKEQLVRQLEDWCARAEASGIIPLQEFSRRLRCYA